MLLDIKNVMSKLSEDRPIFHNEADFQFSMAMKIKELYPNHIVRLEYCYRGMQQNKRSYVDILVSDGKECALIELKYKTVEVTINDPITREEFNLQNHESIDSGSHAILSDLSRVEQQKGKKLAPYGTVTEGYSILLTNDKHYRNGIGRGYWVNFGLKDKKEFKKEELIDFNLGGKKKEETCCKNYSPIKLLNDYTLEYEKFNAEHDYLDMLILQVPK